MRNRRSGCVVGALKHAYDYSSDRTHFVISARNFIREFEKLDYPEHLIKAGIVKFSQRNNVRLRFIITHVLRAVPLQEELQPSQPSQPTVASEIVSEVRSDIRGGAERRRCHFCYKKGHIVDTCDVLRNHRCRDCKETGHTRKMCREGGGHVTFQCFFCHQSGHVTSSCSILRNWHCSSCKEHGHSKLYCPSRPAPAHHSLRQRSSDQPHRAPGPFS